MTHLPLIKLSKRQARKAAAACLESGIEAGVRGKVRVEREYAVLKELFDQHARLNPPRGGE